MNKLNKPNKLDKNKHLNEYNHRYLNASFTIEAVFIIPIIFYIVLLFIYMNFYLHDYNILIAKSNHIIEQYKQTKDEKLITDDVLNRYLNEGLWFSEADNIIIDKKIMKLNLKADIAIKLPQTGIFKIFSITGFNDTYERDFWLLERTETARIFTTGIEVLGRIKGLSGIIEKYYKK